MMYTVIGGIRTRAARVLWMLEELGLPYHHEAVAPRSDAVRAVNPAGKVPVLIDGDTAITDSTAIIQYLADRHGAFTHPVGTHARARQDSLTQFILDEFDAALWAAARHSFILPEEKRLPAIKPVLHWEFARSEETLVARLGDGPFLMGAEMTVPDIIAAHCGIWAEGAKFPITQPRFAEYIAMMRARPAWQRVIVR